MPGRPHRTRQILQTLRRRRGLRRRQPEPRQHRRPVDIEIPPHPTPTSPLQIPPPGVARINGHHLTQQPRRQLPGRPPRRPRQHPTADPIDLPITQPRQIAREHPRLQHIDLPTPQRRQHPRQLLHHVQREGELRIRTATGERQRGTDLRRAPTPELPLRPRSRPTVALSRSTGGRSCSCAGSGPRTGALGFGARLGPLPTTDLHHRRQIHRMTMRQLPPTGLQHPDQPLAAHRSEIHTIEQHAELRTRRHRRPIRLQLLLSGHE